MAGTANGELSRVTVVAPNTRMDLALPSAIPLADLLPTLLFHARQHLADDGMPQAGWALSRLGGAPLDTGRTPAQLEIRDGEVLYLAPCTATAPEVVFDDVVDVIATATRKRPGRWGPATTRQFAVGLATAALAGGVAAVLFTGPPQLPGALVSIGLATALLLGAALVSRVGGDSRTGARLGLVALGYGAVAGLLMLADDRGLTALAAPDVLLAATVVVVLAAAAAVAVGDFPQVFYGAMVTAVAVGLGAGICLGFDTGPATAAAAVGTLVFAFYPALPMIAYRAVRLPVPAIPTGPEDLRADETSVDGRRMLRLSDRADDFHTGLIVTASLLVLGSAVVLVLDGGWRGGILATVMILLLLLRARPYRGRAARMPVLVAGSLGLGGLATAGFVTGDLPVRLGLVVGGLPLLAAASLTYGLGVAGRRISPLWGRLLDIAEVILIISVIPLAAWVAGLFESIATIRN